jgi:ribonuclease P/MRP protein subunit POP5
MVRFKNRYLLIKIDIATRNKSQQKLTLSSHQLSTTIKEEIVSLFGECGMGYLAMAHSVKYCHADMGWGIIRSSREGYRKTWAALTCIKEIQGIPCALRVLHVSGTIKQCQKVALNYLKTFHMDQKTITAIQGSLSSLQD